jgi:thioredoxin 1
MINRRAFIASLAAMPMMAGAMPSRAAEKMSFDAKAFQAAQSDGKAILVDISAPWCPVCKAQGPILDSLWKRPEFKDFAVFDVDFDTQKGVVRSFHATSQSTLIVFKGKAELARSVGDTDGRSIEAFLKKAV